MHPLQAEQRNFRFSLPLNYGRAKIHLAAQELARATPKYRTSLIRIRFLALDGADAYASPRARPVVRPGDHVARRRNLADSCSSRGYSAPGRRLARRRRRKQSPPQTCALPIRPARVRRLHQLRPQRAAPAGPCRPTAARFAPCRARSSTTWANRLWALKSCLPKKSAGTTRTLTRTTTRRTSSAGSWCKATAVDVASPCGAATADCKMCRSPPSKPSFAWSGSRQGPCA